MLLTMDNSFKAKQSLHANPIVENVAAIPPRLHLEVFAR